MKLKDGLLRQEEQQGADCRLAPRGQAITAIAMAISACNEFPTKPGHEWRMAVMPYTYSIALMTRGAVTIQRRKEILNHGRG